MPELVHAAADALKSAIDRHLAACEERTGESDPRVLAAYDDLRTAAERYDDVLFDTFDEVTPFEFADTKDLGDAADDEVPERFGVYLRRDYAVRDLDELLAAGGRASVEGWPAEAGPAPAEEVDTAGRAVYEIVTAQGVDGLDRAAEDAGLDPIGGSLWVVAQDADDDTLQEAPFGDVDDDRLLYRVDEVFEG